MIHSIDRTSPFAYDNSSQSWEPSATIIEPRSLVAGEIFRIISWNIDFMEPFQPPRVMAALEHLENLLQNRPEPTVILLQEIMGDSLNTLLASLWVKKNFQISYKQPKQQSTYFTITLVPRDIEVVSVFRVPLINTHMGRDGLFVDLPITYSTTRSRNLRSVLRICNTHLESLQSGNKVRPLQLCQISSVLKSPTLLDTEIAAGLVGGDMNAISRSDEDLHRRPEIDLEDVYETTQKESGGLDGKEGHTWGYQPPCQYPPGRLDKIMFTGMLRPAVLDSEPCVTRLGVGLKVKIRDEDEDGDEEEDDETEVWLTDHFGLGATFVVLDWKSS